MTEREREERALLGELPADLEGPKERDEWAAWKLKAGVLTGDQVPGVDVIAAHQALGQPLGSEVVTPDSIPVYQLLPRKAVRWSAMSDRGGAAQRQLVLGTPWDYLWTNPTSDVAIATRIHARILPLTDTLSASDVRLTALVNHKPAFGVQRIPMGQAMDLPIQLEIPPYGSLRVRIETPTAPVALPGAPVWSARDQFGFAYWRNTAWMVGGLTAAAPTGVREVWTSADSGHTWTQLPNFPWPPGHTNQVNLLSIAPLDDALYALVQPDQPGVLLWNNSEVWKTTDGRTWTQLVADTNVFSTGFCFGPLNTQSLIDHNGKLYCCQVDSTGQNIFTYESADGSIWTERKWSLLPVVTIANSPVMTASFGGALVFAPLAVAAAPMPWFRSVNGGGSWTPVSNNCPARQNALLSVRGNRLWMFGGYDPNAALQSNEAYWTDDLANWHGPVVFPWQAVDNFGILGEPELMEWGGKDVAGTLFAEITVGQSLPVGGTVSMRAHAEIDGIYLPMRKWG
jgi:hypothetical protein